MNIELFKQKIRKLNTHVLLAELKARLDHAGARPEAWALLEELDMRLHEDNGELTRTHALIAWAVVLGVTLVCIGIVLGIIKIIL
jgi:hypothetical protein